MVGGGKAICCWKAFEMASQFKVISYWPFWILLRQLQVHTNRQIWSNWRCVAHTLPHVPMDTRIQWSAPVQADSWLSPMQFYALYKQSREGPNKSAKPGFWDPTARAKWWANKQRQVYVSVCTP